MILINIYEALTIALYPNIVAVFLSIAFATLTSNPPVAAAIGILFLSLLPFVVLLRAYRSGKIDYDVSDRALRPHFLLFALALQTVAVISSFALGLYAIFVLTFTYLAVTFVVTLITLRWKISIHSAGITGPIAAAIYVFGMSAVPAVVLIPLIIYVRWKIRAHTISQLVAGAIIAVIITMMIFTALWPK